LSVSKFAPAFAVRSAGIAANGKQDAASTVTCMPDQHLAANCWAAGRKYGHFPDFQKTGKCSLLFLNNGTSASEVFIKEVTPERPARRVVSRFLEKNYLVSDTEKGPVRPGGKENEHD
jgi:hypothetical protein